MERLLLRFWYSRSPLARLLAPLSALSLGLYWLRRSLYRLGVLRTTRLHVPVIVVGNITVGGTGKTPLGAWLALALHRAGRRPAIVCSSYRASAAGPAAAESCGDPQVRGDEAILLARLQPCPVWSGPHRAQTALALTAANPQVDVIVCDDGLQHYALARDCEIAVIDGDRGLGNGMLLPFGPLREPRRRLASVDAVVVNSGGTSEYDSFPVPSFEMRLEGSEFRNLVDPTRHADAGVFADKRVAAVAGIGNPGRFFDHLRRLGLTPSAHAFTDHHRFSAADLSAIPAEVILMTEKDAIKCAALADERMWFLPVTATVDDALLQIVRARIAGRADTVASMRGST